MKLCIIGKYPPIQGGVSASTYWMARGLASRGHDVHVVTNAYEVEPRFRIELDAFDSQWYEPAFLSGRGMVRVHGPQSFSDAAMSHIPAGNPFVSKLASLATDVVRSHGCELIFSYYYEPYAVAGALASSWTARPHVVKHAGSDLERLFLVPNLATTYREVLRSAQGVVTQPELMPRFLAMGVDHRQLICDVPFSVPTEVFRPDAAPLDAEGRGHPLAGADRADPSGAVRHASDVPTIGIYGKVGPTKGTYDLIAALGALAEDGVNFRLLAMIGDPQAALISPALAAAGLSGRTWILPFLAHWRVPGFIRACTAVCFLERDFPVAIHGPVVPREVLACGTCLVVSREIASKQSYGDQLVSGNNVVIVDDPRKHAELARALHPVLTNPALAKEIGHRGHQLSATIEKRCEDAAQWEQNFVRLLSRRAKGLETQPSGDDSVPTLPAVRDLVPKFLLPLVRAESKSPLHDVAFPATEDDPIGDAIRQCERAEDRLESLCARPDHVGSMRAALRFQKARLRNMGVSVDSRVPTFPVADRLGDGPISTDTVWTLWPVRSNTALIEEFDYDILPLFTCAHGGNSDVTVDWGVAEERVLVVFQQSPNLSTHELRIDDATLELLALCDGTRTTSAVVDGMARLFGIAAPRDHPGLICKVLEALATLHRSRIIVFGECTAGVGWIGGWRGDTFDRPLIRAEARTVDQGVIARHSQQV